MPFEQHPTDPDKLVMRAGNYNLQKPWVGLTDEERKTLWASGLHYDTMIKVEKLLEGKNT